MDLVAIANEGCVGEALFFLSVNNMGRSSAALVRFTLMKTILKDRVYLLYSVMTNFKSWESVQTWR